MIEPGTAFDDPLLGKDPQPGHMDDFLRTSYDNGGVHINSGIANNAFYLAIEGGTNRTSNLSVQGIGAANREQMEVLMNMLEANIDEPIEPKGNEARMSYGERYEVKFVKEDGAWKIKDLD